MNPEIAINALGTVGLLYQRVVSNHWETHLTRSIDADATVFDDPGILLANTDATTPADTYDPYIGDYASLRAAGKNFFGIFSASNFPDTANFLQGVIFQRYVDWGTHKLYSDAALTTEVPPSIDPYFFEVSTLAPDQDFYVRDWTDDATHGDNGVEPSTHPLTRMVLTSFIQDRAIPASLLPFNCILLTANSQPSSQELLKYPSSPVL